MRYRMFRPQNQTRRVALGALAAIVLAGCATSSKMPSDAAQLEQTQTIYLVRHAEKQGGKDPSLTVAGQERAQILADLLADKGLDHIFSSDYARTRQTAAPIAALTGLTVELYDPSALEDFAQTLRDTPGTHLVVGHSNTTPPLAAALGGDPGTPIYEATEYDRLYVVSIDRDGQTQSRIERFGQRYTPAE